MAAIVLLDARVWVGDRGVGNVPILASGAGEINNVRSITIEDMVETPERTVFKDDARRYLPGLKDITATIEILSDASMDANLNQLQAIFGMLKTFVIAPYGNGVLGSLFTATTPGVFFAGIVTTYPVQQGSIGDVAVQTINIRGDGVLTEAAPSTYTRAV